MNFGFTEEQELLRAEVRKFLDENAPLGRVRELTEAGGDCGPELWGRIAELGWVGLTMPEEHGGVGLDLETMIVVLEETGRSLFPSPLISTVLAAKAIERFGSADQQARWLPGLADGSRVGTFAFLEQSDCFSAAGVETTAKVDGDELILSGEKLFVTDAGRADLFVVAVRGGSQSEAISLVVVEKGLDGVSAHDLEAMDLTKKIGRLSLDDARIGADCVLGELGEAWPAIEWLLDLGAALVTAEAVGAAEAALDITTRFAKERIQFDEPIGRFQGVKHPLAEIYVDVESFKSLAYYAIWALDQGAEDAKLAISRAKAYCADAFPQAGIMGVQLHGGVGYTWEYDIQLYLKRAKWIRPVFGDADHHYERIARLGDL
ncbi:MAG: acyl-CoA/acyl-ACP dehydrogenase [Deltaproteobacteria bacterium]|jgi:alkylation response protein AidB-like acyl-CoA dehydrogenase|nr:acyl-CoA/acyl-ACP dehydrogenase [Deltaproteobacteria bacterium]